MTSEERWIERVKLLEGRITAIQDLVGGRPRVETPIRFAMAMTNKLQLPRNMEKGGWCSANVTLDELWAFLENEMDELEAEFVHGTDNNAAVRDECLDVANFAMMIWDRCR